MIIGSVKGRWDKEPKRGYEVLKESLAECCTLAERLEVSLLLEPLNRYESNLVNTLQEAVERTIRFLRKHGIFGCFDKSL